MVGDGSTMTTRSLESEVSHVGKPVPLRPEKPTPRKTMSIGPWGAESPKTPARYRVAAGAWRPVPFRGTTVSSGMVPWKWKPKGQVT